MKPPASLSKLLTWRPQRPIRFTRFGTWYILFTLAVGAAAINTGNNLLYLVLGLLLGCIVVSGFLSDSCLWGLQTQWRAAGALQVGQPAPFDITASKTWFPGVTVTVEAEWDGHPATRHLFYWIPRHGTQSLRFQFTPERRGILRLPSLRYSTRFPFGLFEKLYRSMAFDTWIVYPRIRPVPLRFWQAAGSAAASGSLPRPGLGTTPFDVRDFRAGDSSKRIHWKVSAKRQRLMVKEMEQDSHASSWLRVSRWPLEAAPAAQEDLISFIASLAWRLHEAGQPVGLITPGIYLEPVHAPAHLHKLMTYLALLTMKEEPAVPAAADRPGVDVVALWKRMGWAA